MTREEAIKKVEDMKDYIIREHSPNDIFVSHMNEAIKVLSARPHGEWIKKTDGLPHLVTIVWFVCSECGIQKSEETPFCPNCGMKMRVNNELNRVSKELNSEIEKSKSEIVPDYRDGWRLREGESE